MNTGQPVVNGQPEITAQEAQDILEILDNLRTTRPEPSKKPSFMDKFKKTVGLKSKPKNPTIEEIEHNIIEKLQENNPSLDDLTRANDDITKKIEKLRSKARNPKFNKELKTINEQLAFEESLQKVVNEFIASKKILLKETIKRTEIELLKNPTDAIIAKKIVDTELTLGKDLQQIFQKYLDKYNSSFENQKKSAKTIIEVIVTRASTEIEPLKAELEIIYEADPLEREYDSPISLKIKSLQYIIQSSVGIPQN